MSDFFLGRTVRLSRSCSTSGPAVPLSMAALGVPVTVVGVNAGRGLARRLAEMGVLPGVRIIVARGGMAGPMIVEVGEARFAIGRGMAYKIMVR